MYIVRPAPYFVLTGAVVLGASLLSRVVPLTLNGDQDLALVSAITQDRQIPSVNPESHLFGNPCQVRAQIPLTTEVAGIYLDTLLERTEVFAGNYGGNKITRFDVDTSLTVSQTDLPLPFGHVILSEDLDADGAVEILVFRGNGSDGTLTVYSEPSWNPRSMILFPNRNVIPTCVAHNLDTDSYVEVFLSLSSLSGGERAMVLKYDSISDGFQIVADVPGVESGFGATAVADFDGDGRIEFVRGGDNGYQVFEWNGGDLISSGLVALPDYYGGFVATCRPKPGGIPYLLMGFSSFTGKFWFNLMLSESDNSFDSVFTFADSTGWSGTTPCYAADIDCDGLDEMIMEFAPVYQVWEWNQFEAQFEKTCEFSAEDTGVSFRIGGLYSWFTTDIDMNDQFEWCAINGVGVLNFFESPACQACSTAGCVTPPVACVCVCHGDPVCDAIRSDVLDVIKTIDAAFRGEPEQSDPGPLCQFNQTDVNCDQQTNIVDVIRVINVAFRGANVESEYCQPCLP